MKITIFPSSRLLRNGERNPREYPYWEELKDLLKNTEHSFTYVDVIVPFDELTNMINNSDVVITIDSFIQHYCWYLGKKCIVLWGVSDPLIFGHKENINILKDRKYLRPNQFDIWETQKYNKNVFVLPEKIMEEL